MKFAVALFFAGLVLAWGCLWMAGPHSTARFTVTAYDSGAVGLGFASGCCFIAAALVARREPPTQN